MKITTKTAFFLVLTSAILSITSHVVLAQFPVAIGGNSSSDQVQNIAADAAGNVYVTGRFDGTADFKGAGSTHFTLTGFYDIYVAKYNSSGVCQWAFSIVTTGSPADADYAQGITTDATGNVFVTGSFKYTADFKGMSAGPDTLAPVGEQDIFVAKYNSSGNYQWAFSMGSPGPELYTSGYSIAADLAGNVLVTGSFQDTADFKGTSTVSHLLTTTLGSDMFVAKYDPSGACLWAFNLNCNDFNVGESITTDASNNVFVTGIWFDDVDADFKGTSGNSNVITGAGAGLEAFVAKYNSDGVNQWAFGIGSPGTYTDDDASGSGTGLVGSVATDPLGNVLVTGIFSDSIDVKGTSSGVHVLKGGTDVLPGNVYVAKYNPSGAYQWAFGIGSTGNRVVSYGLATDATGDVLIAGNLSGAADFKGNSSGSNALTALGSTDVFAAKYDSTGAYQCAFNIGSSGSDFSGNAIATDGIGNMLVTGTFAGTADFDPIGTTNNLTSTGYQDIFISKYNNCTIHSACTANTGPNQSICQGVNTTATIGGATTNGHTYSWSPSTGLSSATVSQPTATPTATTTYTLTETTTATGCQATATVTVFVGTPPSAPVVSSSGATTFCSGENDTLNAGGGYAAYLWSNNATTQSIKVTAQGSYSVTVTNSAGCSAASSPTTVTVNPLPADNGGPDKVICPGVSTSIGAATVNGDTYSWSPAAGLNSSTVSQPTAQPTISTTYTLTETNTTTGCHASNTVKVTLGSQPVPVISASGPTSFCAGGSVTLNAGGGYSAYLWSNGATTQSITVSTQASYSVTVTSPSGCSGASAATDVTVTTLGTPTISQKGDTLFCSITASSYQWYQGSTAVSGATNKFYLPAQNGSYTVTVEQAGCSASSSTFDYEGAGINSINGRNELKVYPSPASAYFTAESKTAMLQLVTLYDVLGKQILSVDIKDGNAGTDGKKVTVNIESLTAGVYFVQLKTNNAVATFRLVKQ